MKLNKIAGVIGSGMLLLSASSYAQQASEESSGEKKGSAVFSPLNVSAGKITSEQEALEKQGPSAHATPIKTWNLSTQRYAACPGPIPKSIPAKARLA